MTLKCLIVDDDPMARKALERLCQKNESLDISATCESGKQALEFMGNEPVDLLFLDIEMPEINGIELLNQLPVLPQIIFTTSKTEYAYEAFEYRAIDYLKKPITLPRFNQAVEKAVEWQKKNADSQSGPNEIFIKEEGRYIRLSCDNILFFENIGDYVRVKTINGTHIIHSTMKSIDEKLHDQRFIKVHRSYIVNVSKIVDIEENTLVIDKTVIPISRAQKPMLMNSLKLL